MDNLRSHGASPYPIAVLHGGPGAPGEVAPVARELAATAEIGVLEPLASVLSDFRVITPDRCRHYPWLERHARAAFFDALRDVLAN